jgi:hypothetical protein
VTQNNVDPVRDSDRHQPLFGRLARRAAIAATAVGLMSGAFAGGFIVTHAATTSTAAATTSPSTSTTPSTPSTSTTPSTPSGTFHANENATHEAGESAAREAQENAGQFPTVP